MISLWAMSSARWGRPSAYSIGRPSSSVVRSIGYEPASVSYATFHPAGQIVTLIFGSIAQLRELQEF